MPPSDTLAVVLAGGAGSRMEVLTEGRAKPALPFAGTYRLIDFAFSNLRHSGIDDVWIVVQFEIQSILDVLAGGRPWDLDRSHGGLRIVPPQQGSGSDEGWHEGNAHALYANRDLIARHDPELLLVLSADHVYKLDFTAVLDQHRSTGAEATVVTTRVPRQQAAHHVVLEVAGDGRITGVQAKPDDPASDLVATEIFVYDTAVVLQVLGELAGDSEASDLKDFGDRLLPALVERGRVYDYRLPGYWKDLGRPETYFAAHADVLAAHRDRSGHDLDLDDTEWPIRTHDVPRAAAYLESGAQVAGSLISPACRIAGTVMRSVLGPGTVVEAGAVVTDAVLMHDVVVRAGARVECAIVDDDVVIGAGAVVGAAAAGDLPGSDELVLLGARSRVDGGAEVPPGSRLDPDARRRRRSPG